MTVATLTNWETKLAGYLNASLVAEASTASITAVFYEEDDPSTARTPASTTLLFVIDPEDTLGLGTELILATSHSTASGITTFLTVTRGLARSGYDFTGSATRAKAWPAKTPIGIATHHYSINSINKVLDGTLASGGTDFIMGNATATNPTIKYQDNAGTYVFLRKNLSTSKAQFSNDGSTWVNIDNAGTATLTAGRYIDTTQLGLGTVQVNNNYALATGAVNTFAVTITGLSSPYTTGEKIRFKANLANTGACTLAVNGGAAKTIKKYGTTTDLSSDDIALDSIVEVVYDGTNYQLVDRMAGLTATVAEINGVCAGATATAANLNTLVGGGDADALHIHSGALIASGYFTSASSANNANEDVDTAVAIAAGLTAGTIELSISGNIYGNTVRRAYYFNTLTSGITCVGSSGFLIKQAYSEGAFPVTVNDGAGNVGGTSYYAMSGVGTATRDCTVSVTSITAGDGNNVNIRSAFVVTGTPGTNSSTVFVTYKIYQA